MARELKTYYTSKPNPIGKLWDKYEVTLKRNEGFFYVQVWILSDEVTDTYALVKRRSFNDKTVAEKEYYEAIGRLEAL